MHMHYLEMLCACYRDIASAYPAHNEVDFVKDLSLIRKRFKTEGLAFLTKTLPAYGKAIDLALATGLPLQIPSFQKKRGSCLPNFLGWLVASIFDDNGVERDDSIPSALVHLRQFFFLFYKLEVPYDETSINRVLRDFVLTDQSLGSGIDISDPAHRRELQYASNLVRRVLGGVCPRNIVPKHGPGSVASGEKSWEKSYFKTDYTDATNYYPLDNHYYYNNDHIGVCIEDGVLKTRDLEGRLRSWEVRKSSTSKVVLVPKNSRGPRLISMEPLEIQWLQQGQCERLVDAVESDWLTRGHINFDDQEVNRFLAYRSSWHTLDRPESWEPSWVDVVHPDPCSRPSSYDLVSVDMKEASDRVSCGHVVALFPSNWVEALMATRSDQTMLPNGTILKLNKFASMGSATCFPVEAIVFWALCMASIRCNNPLFASHNEGKTLLQKLRQRVWVYGDDIILHREDYAMVKQTLERNGLVLNANKCCTARFFRESCGMDAYKGVNVTPLRIKECVGHHWTGQSLMSYTAYSNAAHKRGYTELADYLERLISSSVKIPFTTEDRGAIQFVRPEANVRALNKQRKVRTRFNIEKHYLEAYGPKPRALVSKDHPVTYESYLNKVLAVNRQHDPTDTLPPITIEEWAKTHAKEGKLKADQYSVPRRVSSNRGWTQITM